MAGSKMLDACEVFLIWCNKPVHTSKGASFAKFIPVSNEKYVNQSQTDVIELNKSTLLNKSIASPTFMNASKTENKSKVQKGVIKNERQMVENLKHELKNSISKKMRMMKSQVVFRSSVPYIGVLNEYKQMMGNKLAQKETDDEITFGDLQNDQSILKCVMSEPKLRSNLTINNKSINSPTKSKLALNTLKRNSSGNIFDSSSTSSEYRSLYKKPRPRDIIYKNKNKHKRKTKHIHIKNDVAIEEEKSGAISTAILPPCYQYSFVSSKIYCTLINKFQCVSPVVGFNPLIENDKSDPFMNIFSVSTAKFKRAKTRPPSELNKSLNKIQSGNFSLEEQSVLVGKNKQTGKQVGNLKAENSVSYYTQHSINNAFKVRNQPRVYRSLRGKVGNPKIQNKVSKKNNNKRQTQSIDLSKDITSNFKEYLKAKNIPIVKKSNAFNNELTSPCNKNPNEFNKSMSSAFSTSVSNAREISKLQTGLGQSYLH